MCDFKMNSERELENHMEMKHKDNDQPLLRSSDGINGRYQVCQTCGKYFGINMFLKLHKEKKHKKTENFVFSESMLD